VLAKEDPILIALVAEFSLAEAFDHLQ